MSQHLDADSPSRCYAVADDAVPSKAQYTHGLSQITVAGVSDPSMSLSSMAMPRRHRVVAGPPFVIPSVVEESLTFCDAISQTIIRDVSTSLDMTKKEYLR